MSRVVFVHVGDWNAATDRAIRGGSVADDPRCLFGWGIGTRKGCGHIFGHVCGRPFRHSGLCMAGPVDERWDQCETAQRPADWDDKQRTEANR